MRACRGPTRDRPRNGGRRPGEGSAGRLVDHPRSPEPGSAPRVRRGGPVWPEGQRRPDVDRMRAARSRMAAASNLIPLPEVLEQDWAELDEPKGGLAPGDDGVHAGAVAVVRADAAVAIAVEGGGVTTGAAISLAGDQIDERCFLGLLHGSLSLVGQGRSAGGRRWGFGQAGSWPILRPRGFCREYRDSNRPRQEEEFPNHSGISSRRLAPLQTPAMGAPPRTLSECRWSGLRPAPHGQGNRDPVRPARGRSRRGASVGPPRSRSSVWVNRTR